MMRPIVERLREITGTHRTVRISLTGSDGSENRFGYVVGVSRSLLVLHELAGFHLDGYLVVRLEDISKVRIGKYERTQNRILKTLGVHKSVELPPWLKFGSWRSLFRSIDNQSKCVTVDSAQSRAGVFALGEVLSVGDTVAEVREISATALWVEEPFRIRYTSISAVGFDGEYESSFHKFMGTC